MTYVYTSPLRPLDLGWLPKENQLTFNPVASTIEAGPFASGNRYAFTQPLPERFVFQWSLELVGQPEQEQEYDECGCLPGEPCDSCDWNEHDEREDYNPWERDNDEPELEGWDG